MAVMQAAAAAAAAVSNKAQQTTAEAPANATRSWAAGKCPGPACAKQRHHAKPSGRVKTPAALYTVDAQAQMMDSATVDQDILAKNTTYFNEYMKNWRQILQAATRHGFRHQERKQRASGFLRFFESVEFYDWIILAGVLALFFVTYRWLVHLPSQRPWHGIVIVFWFAMASLYMLLIYLRQGQELAVQWGCGYVLEFIFMLENAFVFQVIINAFNMPRTVNENALYILVAFTVLFQMVFYMGLASVMTQCTMLSYILGLWLVFVGIQAAVEEDHGDFDIVESRVVKLAQLCLGKRLSLVRSNEGHLISANKEGQWTLSLVGLMVCCLLLADFLLEIDVTLTKIAEIGGIAPEVEYICFSSSALATFTLPEFFFIVGDLFERFYLLKYGLSLVVTYLGVGMLLARFFSLNALVNIVLFLLVFLLSMVISVVVNYCPCTSLRHSLRSAGDGEEGPEACWESQLPEAAAGGGKDQPHREESLRSLGKAMQDAVKRRCG